jgi:hypothetical protein
VLRAGFSGDPRRPISMVAYIAKRAWPKGAVIERWSDGSSDTAIEREVLDASVDARTEPPDRSLRWLLQ